MSKIQRQLTKECVFCGTSKIDDLRLGALMVTKNIASHYFCCLLSNQIKQLGRDNQGIYGFLPKDIMTEVQRGSRLKCSYCKKTGATIWCANQRCRLKFHLPCAVKNKAKHEFFGSYRTYCEAHVKKQQLPDFVKEIKEKMCTICLETIVTNDFIWAECCARQTFFHHLCAQKLANTAGYELKCPICKNIPEFKNLLKRMSVFVPDRDAAWELEDNAFSDQIATAKCTVDNCLSNNRGYNVASTLWELIVCEHCLINFTHRICSNMKLCDHNNWHCDMCKKMLLSISQKSPLVLSEKENVFPQNENALEENHNNWTQIECDANMFKWNERICVAQTCKNEFGRLYEDNMEYSFIPCLMCGKLYVHRICDNVKGNVWFCQTHKKLIQPKVLVENCKRSTANVGY